MSLLEKITCAILSCASIVASFYYSLTCKEVVTAVEVNDIQRIFMFIPASLIGYEGDNPVAFFCYIGIFVFLLMLSFSLVSHTVMSKYRANIIIRYKLRKIFYKVLLNNIFKASLCAMILLVITLSILAITFHSDIYGSWKFVVECLLLCTNLFLAMALILNMFSVLMFKTNEVVAYGLSLLVFIIISSVDLKITWISIVTFGEGDKLILGTGLLFMSLLIAQHRLKHLIINEDII